MSEWALASLDELAASRPNSLATGPFGSAVSARNFRSSGVPLIRGSNLSTDVGVRLRDDDMVFLDEEKAAAFSRSQVVVGDLIFTCWGTIGQVGLVDGRSRYDRYIVSNKQMKLSPNPAVADSLFLYYALSSPQVQHTVQAIAIGSSVPGFNLRQLRDLKVPLPPLAEQRAVAEVLGALDDKIDANARLVTLLRDLARAVLQKAADPAAPYVLGDVADVRKGLSYTGAGLVGPDEGMPMVNLANAENFGWLKRSGFKYYAGAYKPRHVAEPGSLLVSGVEQTWRHEIIGWPLLLPDDVGQALFSHHVFLVDFRPDTAWLRLPLWAHLFTAEARARLEGMVYGTTVATLPAEALTGLVFPAPRPGDRVVEHAQDLLWRAWAAERESATLAALRDTLLPPLVSGRLRVREAESLVGEAV